MPCSPSADPLASQQDVKVLDGDAQMSTGLGIAKAEEAAAAREAEETRQGSVGQLRQEDHPKNQDGPQAGHLCAGQADEALLDVDVAEQRRIMRDIWVRQHISRGSPRKADKGHAGNVKRKLKQAGEPGLGSNTTCTT